MNKKYLTICIVTAGTGLIATLFYRPYIYSHKLFDFYLADSIGSLVCVLAFCSFMWSRKEQSSKQKNNMILLAAFMYSFVWEGLTVLIGHTRFDWHDVFAVWIGAMVTYLVKERVDAKPLAT